MEKSDNGLLKDNKHQSLVRVPVMSADVAKLLPGISRMTMNQNNYTIKTIIIGNRSLQIRPDSPRTLLAAKELGILIP
jgi:hypothetical protein